MSKQALLVIDMQVGVCCGNEVLYQLAELTAGINKRIHHFRKNDAPVIFVQHEDEELVAGEPIWKLLPELLARPDDFYIRKTHPNAFYQTELQNLLDSLQIDELEICGAQTEYCVDSTVKFAHGLGYRLYMKPGFSSTITNTQMDAQTTIAFYEAIWNNRFLQFI